MSRVKSTQSANTSAKPVRTGNHAGVMTMAVLATSMLFLPGCGAFQNRHHITVGSIPDDYRTNHPVNISEQEQTLDVPVGSADKDISLAQRSVIQGFVASYQSSGSGPVQVAFPSSGTNAAAARRVAPSIVSALRKGGIPAGMIITTSYAAAADGASPVRIAYRMVTASTDQCGKWPEDIADTTENKHYADFGCSYQNNFAAQLANPGDLLGPRRPGDIDATQRDKVIKDYQKREPRLISEVDY